MKFLRAIFWQIITEYIFHNQNLLPILKIADLSKKYIETEVQVFVKNKQGTDNRGLISIVRKLSPYYEKYEGKNYFDINISQWFDMLSAVRHTIIHSRQKVTKGLLNYFEKHRANKIDAIFNLHFEIKNINEEQIVFLTANKAIDVITWLNSYAHFIFKCLSGAGNLDIRVPLYSPRGENLFQLLNPIADDSTK